MESISFEGQVGVVTGAGRSLGRAYALDVRARSAAVVVSDIGGVGSESEPWAEAVVAEIRDSGGRAVAALDSGATAEGARSTVRRAIDQFERVDFIVHNAGFLRPAMFEDITVGQVSDVMDIHLMADFYLAMPAWRLTCEQGYGRIVLTSSGSVFGNEGSSNYVAAKTGVLGLAKALALEGARHGIKANSILPSSQSLIAGRAPEHWPRCEWLPGRVGNDGRPPRTRSCGADGRVSRKSRLRGNRSRLFPAWRAVREGVHRGDRRLAQPARLVGDR